MNSIPTRRQLTFADGLFVGFLSATFAFAILVLVTL
jgi:hypothetical protein